MNIRRALIHALRTTGIVTATGGGFLLIGLAASAAFPDDPLRTTITADVVVIITVLSARHVFPRWFRYAPRPVRFPERREPGRRTFLLLLACAFVLAFVAGQALGLWLYGELGSDGFDQVQQTRQHGSPGMILLFSVAIAPMAEEALCRGLLYPLLRRQDSAVWAAVLSAGLFAALHGNLVQAALAIPLALLTTAVYERTRKLPLCVLLHAAFNLAALNVPAQIPGAFAHPLPLIGLLTAFGLCLHQLTKAGASARSRVAL